MELKNRWVHFRIRDVFIPDAGTLLFNLYGDDLLQGKVLEVSDSGGEREAFAVVAIEEIKEPVIVPVRLIRGLL